jgi:hypothetical protein
MVSAGTKTAADAARLFNVHPATVSRHMARAGAGTIGGEGVMLLTLHLWDEDQTWPSQRAKSSEW